MQHWPKKKTKVVASQKSFSSLRLQALFLGGEKRRLEICLCLQAIRKSMFVNCFGTAVHKLVAMQKRTLTSKLSMRPELAGILCDDVT